MSDQRYLVVYRPPGYVYDDDDPYPWALALTRGAVAQVLAVGPSRAFATVEFFGDDRAELTAAEATCVVALLCDDNPAPRAGWLVHKI